MSLIAEADAFADANSCGLGGHVTWPNGFQLWFSVFVWAEQALAISDCFKPPLQAHISGLELLAQFCLIWMVHDFLPPCRPRVRITTRCDNGAEAVAEKGLSPVPALALVLRSLWDFESSPALNALRAIATSLRTPSPDCAMSRRICPSSSADSLHCQHCSSLQGLCVWPLEVQHGPVTFCNRREGAVFEWSLLTVSEKRA